MKVNGLAPRSEQPTRGLGTTLETGSEGGPKTRPSRRDMQGPSKPSKMPMLWPSLGSHRCNLLATPVVSSFPCVAGASASLSTAHARLRRYGTLTRQGKTWHDMI